MEELLANTDQLKGKMKEKVIANAEQGILSKKLATIITDIPVNFNAEDYELSMPDSEKVQEIFEELEFRRLRDQFIKLFSGEEEQQTQVTNSPTAKKASETAGAGQFSLFSGDKGSEITETEDSRKSLQDTAHVYQSLNTKMARDLISSEFNETGQRVPGHRDHQFKRAGS